MARVVRHAEKAAIDARANHLVAGEYAAVARVSQSDWQRRIREGFGGPTFSSAADGLAQDYERLFIELEARRLSPGRVSSGRVSSGRRSRRPVQRG